MIKLANLLQDLLQEERKKVDEERKEGWFLLQEERKKFDEERKKVGEERKRTDILQEEWKIGEEQNNRPREELREGIADGLLLKPKKQVKSLFIDHYH